MRPTTRARLRRAVAIPALVLMLLLGTFSVATAADTVAGDRLVLATEADPDAPPPGLDPLHAEDDEADEAITNEFDPEHTDPNFLWGAAVGLGVLMGGGFALLGLLYWLLVLRPARAGSESASR